MLVKEATTIWNSLRGIICVYKPAEVKCNQIRKTIINKICTELSEMECRPSIQHVSIEGDPSKDLTVVVAPSLADDPLVVGPRYQFNDVRCAWSSYLGSDTSGILLIGINDGTKLATRIRNNRLVRAYRIKGLFGAATENSYKTGQIIEKSTFGHVKQPHMDKILASMQAVHQRKMFELCGVDIQSQTAYELAIKGPIRPHDAKIPVLYGIRCVQFNPPEFTLEVQCVNEYESYLKMLIHDLGIELHSTAHCTGIQCIRHSYFTLDNALLRKHWTLQHIITNMEECSAFIRSHQDLIQQKNVALQ